MEEDLDRVNGQLEDLAEELGTVPDENLASKNHARESIIKKLGVLEGQLGDKKSQMRDAEEDLSRVERELGPLQKQSQEHQQISRQLELVMETKSAVKRVIEQFVSEVRAELEEKANHSFRRLLDTDGQKTIKSIKVQEDYTLEVLDWRDRHFLANISAGQRQVVSLCFITALAQVAGGSTVLEVPLFMDTPFGRFSYEHRENLLTELPQITPQWVLLATETELTEKEKGQLKQSGRWGEVLPALGRRRRCYDDNREVCRESADAGRT